MIQWQTTWSTVCIIDTCLNGSNTFQSKDTCQANGIGMEMAKFYTLRSLPVHAIQTKVQIVCEVHVQGSRGFFKGQNPDKSWQYPDIWILKSWQIILKNKKQNRVFQATLPHMVSVIAYHMRSWMKKLNNKKKTE